ncbi:glucokinase [Candidatus Woesearchaeota archaeon]|nr:glucokinase [Candidatus Woesearchaeota archaeon]
MPLILASDVGGTKTILAVYNLKDGKLQLLTKEKYKSKAYKSFEELLTNFFTTTKIIVSTAVFGVPGPVLNNTCKAANLPWFIDAKKLEQKFHFQRVKLANDFYAFGSGVELLPPKDFTKLNNATPCEKKTRAFIGAGTGLGEAYAVWMDGYHVYSSEGAHADFAPRNDMEIALLQFLAKKFGHVSIERLLSGKGLTNIYRFLRGEEINENDDLSIKIVQHALNNKDAVCKHAVDIFTSIYGAEAGNLALRTKAIGGIYIGGGIARTLLPKNKKLFLNAFHDKGRLSYLTKQIPVYIVMNPETGILGAANYARKYFFSDTFQQQEYSMDL